MGVCRVQSIPLSPLSIRNRDIRAEGRFRHRVGVQFFQFIQISILQRRDQSLEKGAEFRIGGGVRGDEDCAFVCVVPGDDRDFEVVAVLPGGDGEVGDDVWEGVVRVGGVGVGVWAVDDGLEGPGDAVDVLVPDGFGAGHDGFEGEGAKVGENFGFGDVGCVDGGEELAELDEVAGVGGIEDCAGGGGAGFEDGFVEGGWSGGVGVVHDVVADLIMLVSYAQTRW